MKDQTLRYSIKIRLAALQPAQAAQVKRNVMRRCNIKSKGTISRYLNGRADKYADMPASVLRAFAEAMNTSMEDLIN